VQPPLFDLDGTLIDSGRDLATAVNRVLVDVGLRALPEAQVIGFVGRGARVLLGRALDAADPQRRVDRGDVVVRRFLEHYHEVLLQTTVAYPGVREGLSALKAAGVPAAVVTNKPLEASERILRGLGLAPLLAAVVGGDSTPAKKPDPLPLRVAAERMGVPLRRCMMVGDSDVDIEAARNAGIPGVWCAWGNIHPDRPRDADLVVTRFEQVVALALPGGGAGQAR
jgi:phosphoglycolate phosphatase